MGSCVAGDRQPLCAEGSGPFSVALKSGVKLSHVTRRRCLLTVFLRAKFSFLDIPASFKAALTESQPTHENQFWGGKTYVS